MFSSYFGGQSDRYARNENRRASDQTTYSTYTSYNAVPVREASKRYSRRSSSNPKDYGYISSQPQTYHSSPEYTSHTYYTTEYVTPKRSSYSSEKIQNKGTFFFSDTKPAKLQKHSAHSKEEHPQPQKDRKSSPTFEDEGYYSSPTSSPHGSPPPPAYHDEYDRRQQDVHTREYEADYRYAEPSNHKSHSRTTSYAYYADPQPKQQARYSDLKTPPIATAADAARARIPAGYSYKNWDPTEEPILLLGSVFDANSLGKWIYDWTVFHLGSTSPKAELAGELWLALIKLAGKIKRAEEALPRIRLLDERDLVDEFLESGERIWRRFNKILKNCEDDMWRAAKKEARGKGSVAMGAKSGCAFVDAMFGRDRNLGTMEKLMENIRLWSKRFDANCDEILRYPSA